MVTLTLFLEILFKTRQKITIRYCPTSGKKQAKFSDSYLVINFALFNLHNSNTLP